MQIQNLLLGARERVRQIEFGALAKLWLRLGGNESGAKATTVEICAPG
jgi:DNA-directed RNA polymerase sigma subunit (sigma70/sigma32)